MCKIQKLKYNEVSVLRGELLKKNKDKCPICKEKIVQGEAALDHCHKTGHIRNTVHRDSGLHRESFSSYT